MRPYSPDSPWDFDPSISYLTHGTYGACPRPVLEAQQALIAELEADPIRFLTREFEGRLDAALAAIALPIALDEAAAEVLTNSIADEERIEVPIGPFPVRAAREPAAAPSHTLLRISAQRYNEAADYERLADALVRRGLARSGARGASAIVAG